MYVALKSPTGNTRGPEATEQLLRSLHRLGRRFELQIRTHCGETQLGIEIEPELYPLLREELASSYPGLTVRPETLKVDERESYVVDLRLVPDSLRMRTWQEFRDTDNSLIDPITGLLATVNSGRRGSIEYAVVLSSQRASNARQSEAIGVTERCGLLGSERERVKWLKRCLHGHWVVRQLWQKVLGWKVRRRSAGAVEHKLAEPLFECGVSLRADFVPDAADAAMRKLRGIEAAFARYNHEAEFAPARVSDRSSLLTATELVTLWHIPSESSDSVARLKRSEFVELAPPLSFPSKKESPDVTVLGRTVFRGQSDLVTLPLDDLRRHLLAIGSTGCGKSVFLSNVAAQQIEAGRGLVLIDPHGQLAEDIRCRIPRRRTNDVIDFDASAASPVSFNPLANCFCPPALVADGIVTAFSSVFGFDAGSAPRMLHIFRNCLLTLIGHPKMTFQSIQQLLTDANYRRLMIGRIENDAVRDFWLTEFNRWNDRDRTQYIASLQNKLGAFTTNPALNAILCNPTKSIDLRSVLDRQQVMICNLSKGTLGHEASTLLGSLLLSSLQIAAMSRADIPEQDRRDSIVVIDEFHSYLADGNTTISGALAESRKYRVSYVLATQFLDQLDPATRAAVLGNCGSILSMRVGPEDARILTELLGELEPEELIRTPRFHGYLRMLLSGTPRTFSMKTLPPPRYVPHRATRTKRSSSRAQTSNSPRPKYRILH